MAASGDSSNVPLGSGPSRPSPPGSGGVRRRSTTGPRGWPWISASEPRARRCSARPRGNRRRCPPLAGCRVLGLGVGEVPLLELTSLGTRLAEDDTEADPERVERGRERGDVAADREDPVHPAAVGCEHQDLVLREEARRPREAGQRERTDDQQQGGERQRARKPDMRSMSWREAIAAITEPAAMNRSALKNACVIRWKIPAV